MKKQISFIVIVISFIYGISSCSKQVVLTGKIFSETDNLSLFAHSLRFLNDSICLYTQEYLLNIDEKYRKTEIKCRYTIHKDKIILKNVDCPDYLKGLNCFSLPDSIQNIFVSMIVNTPDDYVSRDEHTQQLFWAYEYGFINGIKDVDTLLLYKNKTIFYKKLTNCFIIKYSDGYVLNLPVIFYSFSENGKDVLTPEQATKILYSKKMRKLLNCE